MTLFPMWVAPNLITMVIFLIILIILTQLFPKNLSPQVGLAINIVTSVVLVCYCPTATER